MVTGQVKTQLIAHDKEVYDIAFSKGKSRDILNVLFSKVLEIIKTIASNFRQLSSRDESCFGSVRVGIAKLFSILFSTYNACINSYECQRCHQSINVSKCRDI